MALQKHNAYCFHKVICKKQTNRTTKIKSKHNLSVPLLKYQSHTFANRSSHQHHHHKKYIYMVIILVHTNIQEPESEL